MVDYRHILEGQCFSSLNVEFPIFVEGQIIVWKVEFPRNYHISNWQQWKGIRNWAERYKISLIIDSRATLISSLFQHSPLDSFAMSNRLGPIMLSIRSSMLVVPMLRANMYDYRPLNALLSCNEFYVPILNGPHQIKRLSLHGFLWKNLVFLSLLWIHIILPFSRHSFAYIFSI